MWRSVNCCQRSLICYSDKLTSRRGCIAMPFWRVALPAYAKDFPMYRLRNKKRPNVNNVNCVAGGTQTTRLLSMWSALSLYHMVHRTCDCRVPLRARTRDAPCANTAHRNRGDGKHAGQTPRPRPRLQAATKPGAAAGNYIRITQTPTLNAGTFR